MDILLNFNYKIVIFVYVFISIPTTLIGQYLENHKLSFSHILLSIIVIAPLTTIGFFVII